MTAGNDAAKHTYCRKCWYILDGLRDPRCPECGQVFDLADGRTFRSMPQWRWRMHKVMRVVKYLMAALFLLIVMAVIVVLWRHWRNTSVIKEVASLGGQAPLIQPGWPNWGVIWEVGGISVNNAAVGDVELERLLRAYGIRSLFLTPSSITDEGLRRIGKEHQLESLYITSPSITDDGLLHLGQLQHLEQLDISNSGITDRGLVNIRGPELFSLGLAGNPISDEGLRNLPLLPKLMFLSLSNTQITDEGLLHLRRFPKLEWLWVMDTHVTADGLAKFCSTRGKACLVIGGKSYDPRDLKVLASIKSLYRLQIKDATVTDAELVPFVASTSLVFLDLSSAQFLKGDLSCVAKLASVQYLYVPKGVLTEAEIEQLKKQNPSLEVNEFSRDGMY